MPLCLLFVLSSCFASLSSLVSNDNFVGEMEQSSQRQDSLWPTVSLNCTSHNNGLIERGVLRRCAAWRPEPYYMSSEIIVLLIVDERERFGRGRVTTSNSHAWLVIDPIFRACLSIQPVLRLQPLFDTITFP